MADFLQTTANDPDAIRRAILARMFGNANPAMMPPGMAQNAVTPTGAGPQAAATTGPQPAKPIMASSPQQGSGSPPAQPIRGTNAAPGLSGSPANQPPPSFSPVPSEADWTKQNPAPAHTPYVAPDLKHRMLMGLFAAMQEFGHPESGAATMRDYLGDIRRNEEAEANYPQTAAADAHKRYLDYTAGAKAPMDLQDLQAQIEERQARAREANARADAAKNPRAQHAITILKGPNGEPMGASFDRATGKYFDAEGREVANPQRYEHSPRPFNLDEQEFEARQDLRKAKTPEEKAAAQARIEDIRASRQRPPEEKTPKESHLTPGQRAGENRKYQKALDDIETERRARESGTYVHPRSGELMPPMANDELFDRKQRAEDEYKDALEAAGETDVRRFNYRSGQYEEGTPGKPQPAKPFANASRKSNAAAPTGKTPPAEHKVNDEVMYQGKRHKITAIQNGKATLQPLE